MTQSNSQSNINVNVRIRAAAEHDPCMNESIDSVCDVCNSEIEGGNAHPHVDVLFTYQITGMGWERIYGTCSENCAIMKYNELLTENGSNDRE